MVYRFSLPPLVADAFARKDTTYIKGENVLALIKGIAPTFSLNPFLLLTPHH